MQTNRCTCLEASVLVVDLPQDDPYEQDDLDCLGLRGRPLESSYPLHLDQNDSALLLCGHASVVTIISLASIRGEKKIRTGGILEI